MKNKLVYDVGVGDAQDTLFFLKKGYKVVAIDANPTIIENTRKVFSKFITNKQLILLHLAVSNSDKKKVNFYLSEKLEWSSLRKSIADRETISKNKTVVQQKKLSSVMKKYGVPYYCKIDVEGADLRCLQSLKEIKKLPAFISAESECVAQNEYLSDKQALLVLETLFDLGYKKFKLVNQNSFSVLQPNKHFYESSSFITNIKKMFRLYDHETFVLVPKEKNDFCFGDDLMGEWCDYKTAREMLLFHRKDYFKLKNLSNYGFWCDWHAKLSV